MRHAAYQRALSGAAIAAGVDLEVGIPEGEEGSPGVAQVAALQRCVELVQDVQSQEVGARAERAGGAALGMLSELRVLWAGGAGR